ncbi:hypothetical protein MOQ_003336 [Trypanosoma cruzi marinkellei]|uniref:Uncharacterized protein n=1 Tax=Trypanosoma cruzi marinkellei TaxID=85056 RepID=K2MC74_TRYCR|nr:hypothetical protein MOQ_003336 [Trypanosoma cruzi marinkellei]
MRAMRDEEKRHTAEVPAPLRMREIGPEAPVTVFTKQQLQSPRCRSDTAELTVGCAMSEVMNSGVQSSRPTLDAQLYLQRRVSEIVHQIKNASSAHHFCRHVVEIDELLRCDAPMGFTPSMVLAGVPDILYLLCDAVKKGYLPYPMELCNSTVQALAPVRRSPVATETIWRGLNAAPPAPSMDAAPNSFTLPMAEIEERKKLRSCIASKNPPRARGKNDTGGCEMASDDLLPFLPPLLHRSASPKPTTALPGNAEDEVAVSIGIDARRRPTVRLQSQQSKVRPGDKVPRSRKRMGARMSTTGSAVVGATQSLSCLSVPSEKQQQQEQAERPDHELSHGLLAPHTPILRDIPSALQALLYHCALPLVCLTPEDQNQRATAVHTLASAMASMLRIKLEPVDANSTVCPTVKAGTKKNVDEVDYNKGNEQKTNTSEKKFQEISLGIRRAALFSLNALMTHLEAEELTCVNQHFASRNKRRYETTDVAMLPHAISGEERYQTDITNGQAFENTSIPTNLQLSGSDSSMSQIIRSTDSYMKPPRESSGKGRVHRTVPMSIYNGAVALDVFLPLLERWMIILRDDVPGNALLDSSRLLFHHPALLEADDMEKSEEEEEKNDMVVALTTAFDDGISPSVQGSPEGFFLCVSKRRMADADAEEIYLLLRVCFHLSTYKQHALYLIAPDKSSNATYTSLAVLLCLTMARCTEGDKCLSLCVECLWNLLEVVPEETVSTILRQGIQSEASKRYEKGRPFSSLSACESLLYCFIQILLTGYRIRQRELRNDMVLLLTMMLRADTAVLIKKKEALQKSTDAAAYTPLPKSTIYAINAFATTIFDLVCGPELGVNGKTAQMTQRPVETFLRYHTALSPTTRVENLQFKLLGWRMLETFHEWQKARLTLEYLCCENGCSTRDVAADDNVNSHDGVGEQGSADGTLVFDVCRHGFINVLLLYVDLMCSDEAVVTWTREELLTLQKEAWFVLLGLMESAVLSSSSFSQDAKRRSNTSVLELPASAASNMREDDVVAKLPLVKADTQFIAAGGIQCALRYIHEVTTGDAEAMTSLAVSVLSVLSRYPEHRSKLLATTTVISLPTSSLTESVPLLLLVIMHVIEKAFQRKLPVEVLPSAVASTKADKNYRRSTLSSDTHRVGGIGSKRSGAGNGHSLMRGKGKNEHSQRHVETTMKPAFTTAESKVISESNMDGKHCCMTFETDVVIQSLSLLNNVVLGEKSEISMTQQAFLSLGGVPLLLSLVRILLEAFCSNSLFPVNGNGGRNVLLLAVLGCFRGFILGNEVAQRQFVHEDGVHVLLSLIAVFVGWWQRNSMKSHDAIAVDDISLLAPTLTILADLLHGSEEAQEAFLQWSTYNIESPKDMEDNSCVNATQLLLRLWEEEEGEGNLEQITMETQPQGFMNWGDSMEDNDTFNVGNSEKGVVTDVPEEEKKKRVSNDMTGPVAGKTDLFAKKVDESYGDCKVPVVLPILHSDQWGLGLIGIHDRNPVKTELKNRYNELEDVDLEEVNSGMAPNLMTQRARRRLAASLHSVLGLHAKVYACLAAVGFVRLIHVKTSALERVKLLHAAALPSLCEDEVWGAIAESVDLHNDVYVIPLQKDGNDQEDGEAETPPQRDFLVNPIIPDADELVKVLLDVEARATEIKHLSKVCIDMHIAQWEEATQRFLLSRLRQGTESVNLTTLVQQARTRDHPNCTGRTGSILDHVMSRVGQHGTRRDKPSSASSSLPMGPVTTGSGKFLTSRLTLLEKRRKRNSMIRNSFRRSQFAGIEGKLPADNEM